FETVHEFEDTTFYDISTWTMPLAFDLEYAPLSGRRFDADLVGAAASPELPVADAPDNAPFAYAFEWSGYFAPRALNRIVGEEVLAKVATKPFTARTSRGPVAFARGSILVPFDRQKKSRKAIGEIMRTISAEDGIFVHAIESGASADGTAGVDLGGPSFRPLKQPEVLLVVGRDMNLCEAGEIWHLLDFRMHMPVTLRERERLNELDWDAYTHIVFAGGEFGSEEEPYLPEFLPRLRQWINDGGTLIGLKEGAHWARAQVLDFVEPPEGRPGADAGTAKQSAGDTPTGHDPALTENEVEPYRFPYAEKEDRDARELVSGTIFAGDLDITHPLGFGYSDSDIALLKNSETVLKRPPNPFATVIAYATPPVLSGYASEANRIMLEGTA
ncbi:MAG: hypothetical protein ACREIV_13290, partial [Planctomycetaceae bacterium]